MGLLSLAMWGGTGEARLPRLRPPPPLPVVDQGPPVDQGLPLCWGALSGKEGTHSWGWRRTLKVPVSWRGGGRPASQPRRRGWLAGPPAPRTSHDTAITQHSLIPAPAQRSTAGGAARRPAHACAHARVPQPAPMPPCSRHPAVQPSKWRHTSHRQSWGKHGLVSSSVSPALLCSQQSKWLVQCTLHVVLPCRQGERRGRVRACLSRPRGGGLHVRRGREVGGRACSVQAGRRGGGGGRLCIASQPCNLLLHPPSFHASPPLPTSPARSPGNCGGMAHAGPLQLHSVAHPCRRLPAHPALCHPLQLQVG